jgi:intracellular sulfur oxidation DsrE/DsrF family protein
VVTRVLSLVRGADVGSARVADPALDLNAYAVADEVELTLVLKDRGVELALAGAACHPEAVGGVDVPATVPATDLRGLLSSGVQVLAVAEDLAARGIRPAELLDGVRPVPEAELARLMTDHDLTLTTSG